MFPKRERTPGYHPRMSPPLFPAASGTLLLSGLAGPLEVAVDAPEPDAPALPLLAVVCHPLTTDGGTMHNKVVTMAARSLRELGATTVRFNFRGAGNSGGAFDSGSGELDDLRTVVAWARTARPGHALWLGGFSFGAYVSCKLAAELKPGLLLSIAPPVGRSWDFSQVTHPNCPWLVIQGEADEIVDPQVVYAWLEKLHPPQLELVRMPDTSHFFHRKLMDLRGAIKQGVRPYLPAA